ncbi:MAG: molybdopterin-synthase adenylyltransferase MoeB [Thalassobaculales bacterium]
MALTDAQELRYARHLILDEVGEAGQERLLAARVLVVGCGGLGAPVIQYLAAAGVGSLTLVDDDRVDLSNLQRQVIFGQGDLGRPKVEAAAAFVARQNPEVRVEAVAQRLSAANAGALVAAADLVIDGSDNFDTRYLLNDACVAAGRSLVTAALYRFEGQLTTVKAHLGAPHPCWRCLHPVPPPAGLVPRCETAGILGAVAGVMGTLQATEALKELLGLGDSLSGRLMLWDGLSATTRTLKFARAPGCKGCGG